LGLNMAKPHRPWVPIKKTPTIGKKKIGESTKARRERTVTRKDEKKKKRGEKGKINWSGGPQRKEAMESIRMPGRQKRQKKKKNHRTCTGTEEV